MFFLDPLHTGRIRIQDILACGFLDELIEVRDLLLFRFSCSAHYVGIYVVFWMRLIFIYFYKLRDEELSKESQVNNWFSASSALRVYGDYLNLDKDHNGMLSKEELAW